MPLPSGAQMGCATIWLLRIVLRGPNREPFQLAIVRYETCLSYVQIIAM